MTDHNGPDGYGPQPSQRVADIRDTFFGDEPPPRDAATEEAARQAIAKRAAPWKRNQRH